MARFVVSVEETAGGWSVVVRRGDDEVTRGEMARLDEPEAARKRGGFPEPADLTPLEALAPGKSPFETVFTLYARLMSREQGQEGLVTAFGGYLFDCLLGSDGWAAITASAGAESIELALSWPAGDKDLTRLPWEMMRSPERFLSADPRVAITRLVADSQAALDHMPLLPRVLFAVGADLADPYIRAGTEYIGLLRQLRAGRLNTRLLLDASLKELQNAIEEFEPTVVHLICHGGLVRGQDPTLQMRGDGAGGERQDVRAEALFGALEDPGPLPEIVVLNACYSAALRADDRVAAPYAAELVARGIPVAVGMWGRVADRACRLFARRFYEALLTGEDTVIEAAAEGRRAGFRESLANPARAADWAFPTLFLSGNADPGIELDQDAMNAANALYNVARLFNTRSDPAFCDRIEFVDTWYPLLFRRDDDEIPRVLAIREPDVGQQTGKTRLLEELAGRAVADGRAPVLASLPDGVDPPQSTSDVLRTIGQAIADARKHFDVPIDVTYEILRLMNAVADASLRDSLSALVLNEARFRIWPQSVDDLAIEVAGAAIREDLRAFSEAAGKQALLLLDNVHKYGEPALGLVLDNLLGTAGAGTESNPVPVVFTCSSAQDDLEEAGPKRRLRSYFESGYHHVKTIELTAFPDPGRDRLPYDQYLLGLHPPYVVRHEEADDEQVTVFYQRLWDKTQGMPVRFKPAVLEETIVTFSLLKIIGAADDDEILAALRQEEQRGG